MLVLGAGAGWAFAIDALTFLMSAALLAFVRPRERGEAPERRLWVAELRDGWVEVRTRAWVWATILAFAIALLLSFGPWTTLGPTVAEDEYGSAGVFGLLSAALGAGTMLGALLGFRWRPRHPLRTGFLWCLPWPLVGVAFAFGAPLLALVPLFVGAGVGLTLFEIWWDTALAERIAPHLLSRVTAYDWMGSLALLPLSFALAGPVGEAVGPATLLAVGGVLATLALVAGMLVRDTWTMQRLEPAREPEAGARAGPPRTPR